MYRSPSHPNILVPAWWESYKTECVATLGLCSAHLHDTLRYVRGQAPSANTPPLTPRRRDKAVLIYHRYVETHEPQGPHN